MAADYLGEIKAHQPTGPYRLCGYSFGGLVAFEMARRLEQSGDEVGFVGLFDTMMSPRQWPLRAWLPILGGRIALLRGKARLGTVRSLPARNLRVAANAVIASARYRPGFYGGQLTLFMPMHRQRGAPTLEAVWRGHARALTIVETRGDHSTMLSAPHAESTAAALTRCLCRPMNENAVAASLE
jgi:thioesterase domain-containing protein